MADKRKLQAEIDRCIKKIQEGVEAFEDTWQKLHNATNTNQKDKYENDLKKEIKKLQRMRDQIKTWASSNDVKDKSILYEQRKLIETQMERFKAVERETKTKAYSKEGLVSATKVDPAQKAKDETRQWLQTTIDSLNLQIDRFESEIESYSSQMRKKKVDRDKQRRIEDLKLQLGKHSDHIKNLETLMRMLDNHSIDPDKINVIRDDIEYYLEACLDPDFEDNEFLYDDMGLDEAVSSGIAASTTSPVEKEFNYLKDDDSKTEPAASPPAHVNNQNWTSSNAKEDDSRKRLKSDDVVSPKKPTSNTVPSRSLSFPAPTATTTTPSKQGQKQSNSTHSQLYAAAAGGGGTHAAAVAKQPLPKAESPPTAAVTEPKQSSLNDSTPWPTANHVEADSNTSDIHNAVNSIVSSVASLTVTVSNDTGVTKKNQAPANESSSEPPTMPTSTNSSIVNMHKTRANSAPTIKNDSSAVNGLHSLKSIAEQTVNNAISQKERSLPPVYSTNGTESFSSASVNSGSEISMAQQQNASSQQQPKGHGEANVPPLLGVAPLGIVTLTKDQIYQVAMMEACWRHMPHPSDSERLRHYLPRNPCPTPTFYHQVPLQQHDSFEFYLRLSTETLFFIFYYMEATKAQYMAAKALKKQSWRFHTKYMMWFQRHEEPKAITDEYEQGTYIYFDYERWGQRKKEGFTFEYRYLEDRELQ